MTEEQPVWTLDQADGELTLHTGVTGAAARMGHRLTIAMTRWRANVNWSGGEPVSAELVVAVDSFTVLRGDGGVKALSGPEKAVVRSNALKSLSAGRFPEIRFRADEITATDDGFRLVGALHIRGKAREHVIDLRTEDLGESWRLSAEAEIRQTDYGIKPFGLLMGSLQVADVVALSFAAVHPK